MPSSATVWKYSRGSLPGEVEPRAACVVSRATGERPASAGWLADADFGSGISDFGSDEYGVRSAECRMDGVLASSASIAGGGKTIVGTSAVLGAGVFRVLARNLRVRRGGGSSTAVVRLASEPYLRRRSPIMASSVCPSMYCIA